MHKRNPSLFLCALFFVCCAAWDCYKIIAAPVGVPQNITITAQSAMGLQGIYPLTVFNYAEPTTTTAQYSGQSSVTIPANTTGNVVSCATLFPGNAAPICVSVQDVTSGGVALSLGLDSSGTRIPMAANGFQLFRTAGTSGSQIVFYVDNNTATDASLQVTELSN